MTRLRSRLWFDNPDNREMTALYLERYLNYGLTREELQGNKPIIAIAQTGSDLSPCNRHHLELERRVRDGIIAAGGVPLQVPVHPIQETGKRPTASLDRNLAYLSLVETLHGYPLDGVVLTIGCDKTTPALLMAAATVDIPAIALSVGPMLNGWFEGRRAGAGTIVWKAREMHAAGEIDDAGFMEMVAAATPSVGYCNTMGTATTMNSLAEALGMQLPGAAAIPAPHRERGHMSYRTGQRIVEMVHAELKPSDILTRAAFENAVVVCSAIGGSSNAPIHLNAIARHVGVPLDNDDWQRLGLEVPLLCNMQPAGEYLGEDYHRAGGVPAVTAELIAGGLLPHPGALTANGRSIGENCEGWRSRDPYVIATADAPVKARAGFLNLKGNLFESAIMKTSVIGEEFRTRYLENPDDPDAFEGRAIVFDGPEDFHARIDDPTLGIDERCILVMRGAGPIGYPGAAEVVNMRPPDYLIRRDVHALPCIGDGRQSGTSGSPSILNASPEAAAGGGLALLRTGDRIRIDLRRGTADMLVDLAELETRRAALPERPHTPDSQTPWQEIFRERVEPLSRGMTLRGADAYRGVAARTPRDNH
jgi:dihydroxy-acid dehydratase